MAFEGFQPLVTLNSVPYVQTLTVPCRNAVWYDFGANLCDQGDVSVLLRYHILSWFSIVLVFLDMVLPFSV